MVDSVLTWGSMPVASAFFHLIICPLLFRLICVFLWIIKSVGYLKWKHSELKEFLIFWVDIALTIFGNNNGFKDTSPAILPIAVCGGGEEVYPYLCQGYLCVSEYNKLEWNLNSVLQFFIKPIAHQLLFW